MQEQCDTVIVAAGAGTRLGHTLPKAFVPLGGKPLLTYSLDTFLTHPSVDKIILVVPEALISETRTLFPYEKIVVVSGGRERWISVRNGFNATDAPWVLIHDAARPFVTAEVIDALLIKSSQFDCVVTATPIVDTIRTFNGEIPGGTVDRSSLMRTGTPQLFRRTSLEIGFVFAENNPIIPTDEAMLCQSIDIPVGIVWGDPKNFKITTKVDLEIAEAIIRHQQR